MAMIKVKKSFIDAHTGVNHPVGETFEATDERIAEINKVSPDLIEIVKKAGKRKAEVNAEKEAGVVND